MAPWLGVLLAPLVLLGITLAASAAAAAGHKWGRAVALMYVAYGLAVAWPTVTWLRSGSETALFNLPGQVLGQAASTLTRPIFVDDRSLQAAAALPWILGEPQLHAPASVIAWTLLGMIVWWLLDRVAASVRQRALQGGSRHG